MEAASDVRRFAQAYLGIRFGPEAGDLETRLLQARIQAGDNLSLADRVAAIDQHFMQLARHRAAQFNRL